VCVCVCVCVCACQTSSFCDTASSRAVTRIDISAAVAHLEVHEAA